MSHARSIGFILSVALVGAAGCGRSRALSVPNGAVVGTEERPTAVAGSRDGGADAITAMALDAGAAPLLLDASAAADTSTDASPSLPANRYRVIALAVGRTHNCVILDDDTLKCWGVPFLAALDPEAVTAGLIGAFPNQMGDNLKPIDLGAGRKPIAVAIGFEETCAALDDGSFLCWSSPTTSVPAPADGARVVQLAHDVSTVGLFDDGSVRKINGSPGGPTPIDFGGPAAFVAGAATLGTTDCVILRAGGTVCTETPDTPIVPTNASVVAIAITEYRSACGLDTAGLVTCWEIQAHPEWNGNTHVPLGQPATAIGAGDYNGCGLLADGTVKCWAIDGTFPDALGGSVSTSTGWPAVDLGTRPAP